MAVINTFESILKTGEATTEQALALFDSLDPVDLPFMFDRWRGSGLHTGHPLDGFLEATNWYGKEFVDADCVHPLLFSDGNGNIFKIKPNLALMRLSVRSPLLKSQALLPMLRLTTPLFQTQRSGWPWMPTPEKLSVAISGTALEPQPLPYGSRYRLCTDNVPRSTQTTGKPTRQLFPVSVICAVGKESGLTSYIERFNNTLRQRIARLVRKTLSFSLAKPAVGLEARESHRGDLDVHP
jgi:hypothetical protein